MKDKELKQLLEKEGWVEIRVTGSHHIMRKGNKTIPIPIHGKELGKGIEHKIKKQAGLE